MSDPAISGWRGKKITSNSEISLNYIKLNLYNWELWRVLLSNCSANLIELSLLSALGLGWNMKYKMFPVEHHLIQLLHTVMTGGTTVKHSTMNTKYVDCQSYHVIAKNRAREKSKLRKMLGRKKSPDVMK